MNTQGVLVRAMNAATKARERGFINTADAFDGIVESLLRLMNSQTQSIDEKGGNSSTDEFHFH